VVKGIDKVSAADIQRVARDIFKTNQLNLAIIGPHTDEMRLKSILQI